MHRLAGGGRICSKKVVAAPLSKDLVVIETGGEGREHQFDRLRFLTRELQRFNAG